MIAKTVEAGWVKNKNENILIKPVAVALDMTDFSIFAKLKLTKIDSQWLLLV
ncbi:hypothetical protein [Lacticaseibacillus nasuensis]|uniref:Uncharacterized protein n=1 Tax=Lacticaseibacillus nasuensis JCM 17158 TaxID=1291734 RepID=A0A0R1K006_9LACO|nr:hypothetical protein [Lacticaseibacillus nasuensis]KRK74164.1 hypothetical protein FD02_GL000759 [Lacticaseibacillus nasuensis JCM 17158]